MAFLPNNRVLVPAKQKLIANNLNENFLPAEQIFVLGLSDCELEQMLEEAMFEDKQLGGYI
ncbi:MAG: hypothetical protein ACHBN1_10915 [Heteroscytonema crispum UTEX LB 1556]